MAKSASIVSPSRSPRGTKPVSQAFLTALDSIPEGSRPAVAKAAQAMIREELKSRREKIKASSAKQKASKGVGVKAAIKRAIKSKPLPVAVVPKRRSAKSPLTATAS